MFTEVTPQSLADFPFKSAEDAQRLRDIVDGSIPFPSVKHAICFYGMWGTGKTTVAKLVPTLMERTITGDLNADGHTEFVTCASADSASTVKRLKTLVEKNAYLWNKSGRHYVLFDETDNLNKDAQQNLKALMTRWDHVVWLMTTNHIGQLDKGLLSRSVCFDFNKAPTERWMPIAVRWLRQFGCCDFSEATIFALIENCEGDVREILTCLQQVALGRKSKTEAPPVPIALPITA